MLVKWMLENVHRCLYDFKTSLNISVIQLEAALFFYVPETL